MGNPAGLATAALFMMLAVGAGWSMTTPPSHACAGYGVCPAVPAAALEVAAR